MNDAPLESAKSSESAAIVPSLASLVREEPRNGPLDQDNARALASLDGPALPGAAEANEREAYRQKLIAANRALDGRTVNSTVEGALVGMGLAAVGVVFGLEVAVVGAVAVGGWKLVSFLRGRP
jgi:hypothetical protein